MINYVNYFKIVGFKCMLICELHEHHECFVLLKQQKWRLIIINLIARKFGQYILEDNMVNFAYKCKFTPLQQAPTRIMQISKYKMILCSEARIKAWTKLTQLKIRSLIVQFYCFSMFIILRTECIFRGLVIRRIKLTQMKLYNFHCFFIYLQFTYF